MLKLLKSLFCYENREQDERVELLNKKILYHKAAIRICAEGRQSELPEIGSSEEREFINQIQLDK